MERHAITAEHLGIYVPARGGHARRSRCLTGLNLTIEEGSFVAVLGPQRLRENPPWPSISTPFCCPPAARSTSAASIPRDEDRLLDIRRNVGMVFQNPDNQIVANVVEEDVAFAPGKPGRCQPEEIRRRVDERPEAGGHVRIPQPRAPSALRRAEAAGRHCGRHRHASPSASCWTSPPPCWTPRAGAEVHRHHPAAEPGEGHHRGAHHPPYGRGGPGRPGRGDGRWAYRAPTGRPRRYSPRWSCCTGIGPGRARRRRSCCYELRQAGAVTCPWMHSR